MSSSVPVYPVSSAPYPSYSVCTETATLIWRSTTSYSAYEVTHTKGPGGWGYATGTVAASPTASGSGPGYSPIPATGAGAKRAGAGLGAFGLVAGVAALLL